MDSDRQTNLYASNQPSPFREDAADTQIHTHKQTADVLDASTNNNVVLNGGGAGDVSSDDDGFMSGGEEFETPSTGPVLIYSPRDNTNPIPRQQIGPSPFVNSQDFYTPNSPRPIAKLSLDDDDDDEDDDDEDDDGDENEGSGALEGYPPTKEE